MVIEKIEKKYARFEYTSKYPYMVLGDTFENKVAWYLKNIGLGVSVIKNYLINGGELFFRKGEKCYRNGKVILLDDGSIKDFEIHMIGKYTIFGDNGTDIWCNFRGYPLLVQCKYRTICSDCDEKRRICFHSYWKNNMIEDVEKLDKKLSEYN